MLELKSGISKMGVTRWLIQRFQTTILSQELAFTSFLSISVPPRVCTERYFNKIISQKLNQKIRKGVELTWDT